MGRPGEPAPDRLTGFPPVVGRQPRVLVLGSMPSTTSLARVQYYGHPQNLFWPFMGELVGAGPDLAYDARLAVLRRRRIALWDVARHCRREASSDASMREVEPNDIPQLLRREPTIGAVFCNGRKAEQLFDRLVRPALTEPLPHIEGLPSTSPANASIRRDAKLDRWRALCDWL